MALSIREVEGPPRAPSLPTLPAYPGARPPLRTVDSRTPYYVTPHRSNPPREQHMDEGDASEIAERTEASPPPTPLRPHTQLDNQLLDEAMAILSGGAWKCLCYLVRQTRGYQHESVRLTLTQLCEGRRRQDGSRLDKGTGLSRHGVIDGLGELSLRRIVTSDAQDRGRTQIRTYTILPPDGWNVDDIPSSAKSALDTGAEKGLARSTSAKKDNASAKSALDGVQTSAKSALLRKKDIRKTSCKETPDASASGASACASGAVPPSPTDTLEQPAADTLPVAETTPRATVIAGTTGKPAKAILLPADVAAANDTVAQTPPSDAVPPPSGKRVSRGRGAPTPPAEYGVTQKPWWPRQEDETEAECWERRVKEAATSSERLTVLMLLAHEKINVSLQHGLMVDGRKKDAWGFMVALATQYRASLMVHYIYKAACQKIRGHPMNYLAAVAKGVQEREAGQNNRNGHDPAGPNASSIPTNDTWANVARQEAIKAALRTQRQGEGGHA